jgi:uncharacterized protein with ParB-like and HNH nuclease domain
MRTTATNRRLRVLLTAIREKTLIPRPEFQRRLVWSNKHKIAFLQTVLLEYPFPEIYVAAGDVNAETGEATELLVDGQQRISTLLQYFLGSDELKLGDDVPAYTDLSQEKKLQFLDYDVVVRDLGNLSITKIKEVFQRINSTDYALNPMEVHNARYEGAFKKFGEELAAHDFFERHRIFSSSDVKRMQDLRLVLIIVITMMSTYFNRDDELESYLEKFNDEFDQDDEIRAQLYSLFDFIESAEFNPKSRVWKKADLFTLIVELNRALYREHLELDPKQVGSRLSDFYNEVDRLQGMTDDPHIADYYKASLQATNDRSSRIRRGEIISQRLREIARQRTLAV